MLGVETLHPMVSVVNLSEARPMEHMRHTNGFYSVMLKDEKFCDIIYGHQARTGRPAENDYRRGLPVRLPISAAPEPILQERDRSLACGVQTAIIIG